VLGFDRTTFDPHVMGGRACIRGMRITVSLIVNLVANGMTMAEITDVFPDSQLMYQLWLDRDIGR